MSYTIWNESRELLGSEKAILKLANIPQYQWQEADLFPDSCDVEAFAELKRIREYIAKYHVLGGNLIICGKNLGCGKTEWALKLMLTFIEANSYRLKYVDKDDVANFNIASFCKVVPFLVDMKQFGNNKRVLAQYNRLKISDLVVLDDISVLPMSNYDYGTLYSIVEDRLWAGLPTIYTTNATTLDELGKSIDGRLAERIWKTAKIIELKGEGYRSV